MPANRSDRLNEEMKKVISEAIRELKDPRLSAMTTIVQVEITPDLKHAKVRVSVYDKDDGIRQASVDALNHANGFIAREIGRRMQIRRLPMLHFVLDNSIEYSVHIASVIESISSGNQRDAERETDHE